MDKTHAKQLSLRLDNYHLKQMLDKAKEEIKDWTVASKINKGLSKGTVWNILANNFEVDKHLNNIVKYNLIREYGEFLPESLQPRKKQSKPEIIPVHQDPIFK
ncbi:hypothetical protein DRF62_02120 [Chryseobacterium piscium]|uniref:Uncharacterized protein n=1 Tax=Chryseobacterium piscium TaxID=333702 RepID=A0A3D9BUB1_9FLAO|nr:hypothetical protein [Chryseobacterium piscium]REC56976.1 hypothetical protein DRF62_02120 [Chryseobacterium piscium]